MSHPARNGLAKRVDRLPTLVQEVADRISANIADGSLQPGARLPTEKELIESLDVSRTVVREAVAQLRAEGLVKTRQGLGAFVAEDALVRPLRIPPSEVSNLHDLVELTELRLAVELESAALACERATKGDIDKIETALNAISKRIREGGAGASADFQFHCRIAEATHNPHFLRIMTFLGQYIIPRKSVGAYDAARESYLAMIQEEHQAIFDAIKAKDPAAAQVAVRHHLGGSRNRLQSIWEGAKDEKDASGGAA